ncbi:anti-sigma factor domain-containing protein [Actinomadura sp. 9N407]|uniref:anti-sigma factor n=1 Tax=Actinomadura sp. 9N407 TaxID=3375154 RepID=UPI0037B9BA12
MTHDSHTLAGAYALDALSDTERRRFEGHLAECPTCAEEVRSLRETSSRLALGAAGQPPPGLHDRVFADIQRTRQLPPRLSRNLRAARTRHAGWLVAAACLVLALIAGTAAVRFDQNADQARALNRQITEVIAAPDARAATAQAPSPHTGTVTVVASRSLDKAVIAASRLQRPPDGKTYQLWAMGPTPPRPAGFLRSGQGPAGPVITTGLGNAQKVGLTIEPDGGSPQPTSPPIVTLPLA